MVHHFLKILSITSLDHGKWVQLVTVVPSIVRITPVFWWYHTRVEVRMYCLTLFVKLINQMYCSIISLQIQDTLLTLELICLNFHETSSLNQYVNQLGTQVQLFTFLPGFMIQHVNLGHLADQVVPTVHKIGCLTVHTFF